MFLGLRSKQGIGRIKDSMEMQDMKSQMSVGINIIVTMFSCFVVGWYLGGKYFDDDVLVCLYSLQEGYETHTCTGNLRGRYLFDHWYVN